MLKKAVLLNHFVEKVIHSLTNRKFKATANFCNKCLYGHFYKNVMCQYWIQILFLKLHHPLREITSVPDSESSGKLFIKQHFIQNFSLTFSWWNRKDNEWRTKLYTEGYQSLHWVYTSFTSFDSNDGSTKAERNREAFSHIDNTVKQMIFSVRIWNNTVLLLQRLHTHMHILSLSLSICIEIKEIHLIYKHWQTHTLKSRWGFTVTRTFLFIFFAC